MWKTYLKTVDRGGKIEVNSTVSKFLKKVIINPSWLSTATVSQNSNRGPKIRLKKLSTYPQT
jgi:hypothetical protein